MVHDAVKTTETFVMNPKAITMGELYGEYNLLSQEWTDGLGSGIMRNCIRLANDIPDVIRWCIFDGPIDAVWIENMNTVLDDNCMLCLANGERIKLNWSMRMLFEVQDLDEASPATVSRLGVIYVPPSAVNWQPLVTSWLERIFPRGGENETDKYMYDDISMKHASVSGDCERNMKNTLWGISRKYEAIVKGDNVLEAGLPESFNVLLKELKALGLNVELLESEDSVEDSSAA